MTSTKPATQPEPGRFTDRYKDADGNAPKCIDCGEPYDWPGRCPKCLTAEWVRTGKMKDPVTGKRNARI